MDTDIEKKLAKSFIVSRKVDRAIFELLNPSMRTRFIWNMERYLDERYLIAIDKHISSYRTILEILQEHGAGPYCYAISLYKGTDGKIIRLDECLEETVYGGPALISCVHGKLGYFEDEPNLSKTRRYLLIRK